MKFINNLRPTDRPQIQHKSNRKSHSHTVTNSQWHDNARIWLLLQYKTNLPIHRVHQQKKRIFIPLNRDCNTCGIIVDFCFSHRLEMMDSYTEFIHESSTALEKHNTSIHGIGSF